MRRRSLSAAVRWRVEAVKSHYLCNKSKPAAVNFFSKLKGKGRPQNPHRFIPFWVEGFECTGTVLHAPIPGAPRQVLDDVALQCAQVLAAGVESEDEEVKHYASLREAKDSNPLFREVLDTYNCSEDTLLRAMHRAMPALGRRKQEVKWRFTDVERMTRVACAAALLRLIAVCPLALLTFIFVDEASLYRCAVAGKMVWCSKFGDHPLRLTERCSNKSKDHVKFYLALSPVLGAFGPYYTTGTTGQEQWFTVCGQTQWAASPAPNSALST